MGAFTALRFKAGFGVRFVLGLGAGLGAARICALPFSARALLALYSLCMGFTLYASTQNSAPIAPAPTAESASESMRDSTQATQDSNAESTRKLPTSTIIASRDDALSSPSNLWLYGKDTILHSGDVAKSMLLLPGFQMARKGGAGSEIYFRSQGASRLPVLLSGGVMNGACGGRMDTTITYTFPENYDTISIIKGPQDVRYGGLIAGGVVFDRNITRLDSARFSGEVSALAGGFGRFDSYLSALGGGKYGSLQVIGSHYSSDDYRAGDSRVVHSAYKRESASVIGTLTPTKDSALEFDIDVGRGHASYADRGMDARTFDRISYNLRYAQHFDSALHTLDVRAWRNSIDHIMDNFSYRPTSGMYMLSNPRRTSTGGRIEAQITPSESLELFLGASYNHDYHELRTGSGMSAESANAALSSPYTPNYAFDDMGVYAQGALDLNTESGLFFGARYDSLRTKSYKAAESLHNSLTSGFARYERYMDSATFYLGLGSAQRGADFWERSKVGGLELRPERNTQLDMGVVYRGDSVRAQASGFASYMSDYIVLFYGADSTSAFNTNATLLGGELEAEYIAFEALHLYGSLSYTYAQNLLTKQGVDYRLDSHAPLPQIAPLQAQASLFYERGGWLARLDSFVNAAQTRYAKDFGNVVGRDLGRSGGFVVLNLYGGYRSKRLSVLCGVDNLTNTLYAYHLSKSGVDIGALDIAPTMRIYEPGRSFWGKVSVRF